MEVMIPVIRFVSRLRGDKIQKKLSGRKLYLKKSESKKNSNIDNKNILQLEKPLEILRAGIIDNEPMLKTPWGDKRLADKAVNK